MTDEAMKGCVRASETIRALEAECNGADLRQRLWVEAEHARRHCRNQTFDCWTRSEWCARRAMYLAALRRLDSRAA